MGDVNVGPSNFLPYNPYKFSVYRNAALNSASATFTKVNFDTKLYDTSGNFDAITNFRFTAPVSGFYHFSWAVESSASASRWIAALYKNTSTEVARGSDINVAAAPNSSVGSKDLQLVAGDTVEVQLFANTVIAVSPGLNSCYFDGFLVSLT